MKSLQAIPIVTLALMPCAVNCAPEGAALDPIKNRALYDMETITFEEMEPDKPAIVESEVFTTYTTFEPTSSPTFPPTMAPVEPTEGPTASPTFPPTSSPVVTEATSAPTGESTLDPTLAPTLSPTLGTVTTPSPTAIPTYGTDSPTRIGPLPGYDEPTMEPTIEPTEYVKIPDDDDDYDYVKPPHLSSSSRSSKSSKSTKSTKSTKASTKFNSSSKSSKSSRSAPLEGYSSSTLNRVSSLNSFADISSAPMARSNFGYRFLLGVSALTVVAVHAFLMRN
mmetsp:Transcript_6987/g.14390  ORF Transcript_6987/g.14390 Transcript_6987/m.14390 type:complete len:280 (+) Transcript_6987:206-1045(+)